jgi:hypothetical protein
MDDTFSNLAIGTLGSLIATLIAFLAGYSLRASSEWWSARAFKQFLGRNVKRGQSMQVTLTTRNAATVEIHPSEFRHVDVKEVEAFAELASALRDVRIVPTLLPSTTTIEKLGSSNCILLGGPNANASTRVAIDRIANVFPNVKMLRGATEREPRIVVNGIQHAAELDAEGHVVSDTAVLIRIANPFSAQGSGSQLFIAFGLHARGTKASVGSKAIALVATQLRRGRIDAGFLAVLRFDFRAEEQGKPTLIALFPQNII